MADLIPSGYRFSTITPDDHGGYVYIGAFLAFTYANLTFLTRCFIKWQVFGFDDWAMCVAQVQTSIRLNSPILLTNGELVGSLHRTVRITRSLFIRRTRQEL